MAASTLEVGKKLVELCNAGKNIEAIETLYSDDTVSVEAHSMPGHDQTVKGKEAVLAKNKWWVENHEVHDHKIMGPWPHDDRFIIYYMVDVTPKAGPMKGHRMKMEEGCLYTVKNGKVTKEEFFYSMGG